ncbi:MAG: hypothetical protein WC655_21000 [Candidatus Hydrogenedentales bacterium]
MGSRSYKAFIILRRLFWTTSLLIVLDAALLAAVAYWQHNSPPGQRESFEPAIFVFGIAWLPMGFLLFFLGIAMLIANGLSAPRSSTPSRDWRILLRDVAAVQIVSFAGMILLELAHPQGRAPDGTRLIVLGGICTFSVALLVFGHLLHKLAQRAKLRDISYSRVGVDGESSAQEGIRHGIQ